MRYIIAAVLAATFLAGCNSSAGPKKHDAKTEPATETAAAVAKVNGKDIPQARVDFFVKQLTAQGQTDSPELRQNVREELINREIVSQEAVNKGLDKNPDFAAQMDVARQNLLVGAYLKQYAEANPIKDEELKAEYEKIKAQQVPTKEYLARHILVEKEAEAKTIIAQLKKGANFNELAIEKSKDPGSKVKGGELSWAPATNYVKPFADALAALEKGETTTTPVQSEFGWHVIKLEDERTSEALPYEEVKQLIQQRLQKQQLEKLLADLRAKAKVE
ncbi:MAG TPA: peptidylprolyl isomerase [Burkholderiales bacterium]|nr:peptidylprolyl isomerase [Burkholderiales bacterium]